LAVQVKKFSASLDGAALRSGAPRTGQGKREQSAACGRTFRSCGRSMPAKNFSVPFERLAAAKPF